MAIEAIVIVVIGIIATALNILYLRTENFRQKVWIITALFLLWIAGVIDIAHFFYSYVNTVEQGFAVWSLAFGVGCIAIAFEAFGLLIGNPKRKLTENDKMKLKDI